MTTMIRTISYIVLVLTLIAVGISLCTFLLGYRVLHLSHKYDTHVLFLRC